MDGKAIAMADTVKGVRKEAMVVTSKATCRFGDFATLVPVCRICINWQILPFDALGVKAKTSGADNGSAMTGDQRHG